MSRSGISRSNSAWPDALERFYTNRPAEVAAASLRHSRAPNVYFAGRAGAATALSGAHDGWWMRKHFVRAIVAVHLLKPLGNPPANSVKFFATLELLELVNDRTGLAKVTNPLNQQWQKKNAAK